MNTLVVINGSYHPDGLTTQCLEAISKKLCDKHNLAPVNFFLDDNIRGCASCRSDKHSDCVMWCRFEDQFQTIAHAIQDAKRVLIGTPVYLDFPSPKLLAFISRLNCLAEKTNREFFRGRYIHIHANAYVSGTKSTIQVLMSACEMLGFTIEGRSTTEYIQKWSDHKIRGGMTQEDACFLS